MQAFGSFSKWPEMKWAGVAILHTAEDYTGAPGFAYVQAECADF